MRGAGSDEDEEDDDEDEEDDDEDEEDDDEDVMVMYPRSSDVFPCTPNRPV
jgi:hypothetical protein